MSCHLGKFQGGSSLEIVAQPIHHLKMYPRTELQGLLPQAGLELTRLLYEQRGINISLLPLYPESLLALVS